MQTERGGLVGPGGKFSWIVPIEKGLGIAKKAPPSWPIHFDADSPDGDAEFELSQPDSHFCVTAVNAGCIVGWDNTQYSGDLTKQFYGLEANRRGAYESPAGYVLPDGAVILIVEHQHESGRRYVAAPLAWLKK